MGHHTSYGSMVHSRGINPQFYQPAAANNCQQVADEIPGTYKTHLTVTKLQIASHGRQEHAKGKTTQSQDANDGQHTGENDNPAIMDGTKRRHQGKLLRRETLTAIRLRFSVEDRVQLITVRSFFWVSLSGKV